MRVYFSSCGSVDWLDFAMSTEKPVSATPFEPVSNDPVDRVIRYHVQTKHHFNRYARALGYLDWANQPDPFRRFEFHARRRHKIIIHDQASSRSDLGQ